MQSRSIYVQNVVGQILKDLRVREWDDWRREDLRVCVSGIGFRFQSTFPFLAKSDDERNARKRWLANSYPGLLTGPHGVSLGHRGCLLLYILSADIQVPSKTNLQVAIVLWATGDNLNVLSFFNNHLDGNASFESFAIDGESTSKDSKWAVGEKGKGFILATQYLAEVLDEAPFGVVSPDSPRPGISFRVGSQIGELKWKRSRNRSSDSLRLILNDLTTRTDSEYLHYRWLQGVLHAALCSFPLIVASQTSTTLLTGATPNTMTSLWSRRRCARR